MCIKKIILAGTLAGVAAFAWSSISWMALPLHQASLSHFKSDAKILEQIDLQTASSGIYVAPSCCSKEKPISKSFVFAAVTKNAPTPADIAGPMGLWLLLNIVVYSLIALMVAQFKNNLGYFKVVSLVGCFGLASGLFVLADTIWWNFPIGFTALTAIDQLVGAFIAGLIIAKFLPEKPKEGFSV